MTAKPRVPIRDTYTTKSLITDIKKLKLTPSTLYIIGTEIVYHEWQQLVKELGSDDEVTQLMEDLMQFMQSRYERQLLDGDLRRETDTPNAAMNNFLRDTPAEFQSYVLNRSGEYIGGVLRAAETQSRRDIERYQRMEQGLRVELKKDQNNPDTWNSLRLVLWLQGNYEEASEAFKRAKKLGWEKKKSKVIGI